MRQHGVVSGLGRAGPDGLVDLGVLVDQLLGVAGIALVELPAGHRVGLGELLRDGLEEPDEQAVVGGLRHGVVEGGVVFLALLRVQDIQPLPHALEHGADLVQLLVGGALCGQAGVGGLEDAAHLEHVQVGTALHRQEHGQGADDVIRVRVPDEGALSRTNVDDPEHLEGPDGLSDRELLGQFPLGQQLVPGLQAALGHELLDLLDDLFVEALGLDGREIHGFTLTDAGIGS